MTLDEIVLQKVAEWRPVPNERQTLGIPHADSGWAVQLTANRCDDLGALLWEVVLQRIGSPTSPATLQEWANSVVNRVTGLVEQLQVLEIDAQRDEALLRSNEPTQRSSDLFYYEVILKGTREAHVCRFKAPQGEGRRQRIAFALTHEVLAKLVKDLALA